MFGNRLETGPGTHQRCGALGVHAAATERASKRKNRLCAILVLLFSEMTRRQVVERGREGVRKVRQLGVGPGGGRFSESFKTVRKKYSFSLFPKYSLSPSFTKDVEGVLKACCVHHDAAAAPGLQISSPGRPGYLSPCRKAQALADAVLCQL